MVMSYIFTGQTPVFKLPRIDIPDFDGDIQKFLLFIESFRTIVHNIPALSDAKCLKWMKFIIRFLNWKERHKPFAWELHLPLTTTGCWITQKYEEKRTIAISYWENILNLAPLGTGKAIASNLESFIDLLSTSVAALRQLNIE